MRVHFCRTIRNSREPWGLIAACLIVMQFAAGCARSQRKVIKMPARVVSVAEARLRGPAFHADEDRPVCLQGVLDAEFFGAVEINGKVLLFEGQEDRVAVRLGQAIPVEIPPGLVPTDDVKTLHGKEARVTGWLKANDGFIKAYPVHMVAVRVALRGDL